jgi:DNA replication protein DnaC
MSDAPDTSPTLHTFRPLPPGIGTLLNPEGAELAAEHSNLPHSPAECITCHGTKTFRWYVDAGYTEVGYYACPCEDQYIAHRYFLRAGIPLNYQRMHWTDLHTEDKARDEAIGDYVENAEGYLNAGTGMILTGEAGAGKTLISALLLKRLLGTVGTDGKSRTGRMVDTSRLVTEYMATWSRDGASMAKYRLNRDVLNVDILVVDDLGRERQGGTHDQNARSAAQSSLEAIFRHRVQACLPTIVSTNKTSGDLHGSYGSHITNVLDECSVIVNFTGENGRPVTQRRTIAEVQKRLVRPIFYGS